jgi:D-proline reductase (dithiol) PrdB
VGQLQREIEAAGLTTIVISNIPDLTACTSVPRMVALEHPFGRTIGNPGDRERQLSVLRETLKSVEDMKYPGEVRHLPYKWEKPPGDDDDHPGDMPPIVGHIVRHPWQLPRLLNRDPPV